MSFELKVGLTVLSSGLFIICVVVQNLYPEIFVLKEDEKAFISIRVDISNKLWQLAILIGILIALISPILSWVLAFIYSLTLIYTGYRNTRNRYWE